MADRDKEDLDNIAKAFGLVVIQWGNAEQSLDMLIALLWQSFPTRVLLKRIPVMLAPKLEFARKAFAVADSLKLLEAEAEAVFSEFDRLSKVRHDLIHGAVASLAPVAGHFVLIKFDVHDDFHHVREVRLPVSAYPQLALDLVNLGKSAGQLTHTVFEVVKKQDAGGGK
ncbi:hypothetical protein [Noviherbaspirillum sp.]|uniref:hypothetical protein n=1 Tax=Noviherbaspirillum sp. TaxID=1926288 RepID=UPI002B458FDA|nr:hypothetical protein [Noviherbaspirillum sp.]HJV79933.1 hypothetical protein [Noviherbaspirillum sp.]